MIQKSAVFASEPTNMLSWFLIVWQIFNVLSKSVVELKNTKINIFGIYEWKCKGFTTVF